jgi:hypothetical protein
MNVLLDVDGVLIRDPAIIRLMQNNITRYVRMKVPKARNPEKMRTYFYKKYGHTARGITKTLGIPTPDFNVQVYDKALMDMLAEHLVSAQFQKDADVVRKLLNDGNTVTLFSNAPGMWTWPISCAIDLRVMTARFAGLKPQPVAYTHVRGPGPFVFVDDLYANLVPIKCHPDWFPVHFSEERSDILNITDLALLLPRNYE